MLSLTQVYTVGPEYAHAEARKSPSLDGKVERDSEGKEIRYPVILNQYEKEMANKVCKIFKVWCDNPHCDDTHCAYFPRPYGTRKKYNAARKTSARIKYTRYWPRVRSRWLNISRVLFVSAHKNAKGKKKNKRIRPISSHLDRTSLVNEGFVMEQKDFALIRIKNDLFISTGRSMLPARLANQNTGFASYCQRRAAGYLTSETIE